MLVRSRRYVPASQSNRSFIQKGAHDLQTFAPGGVLLPKQSEQFIRRLIVESKLLQECNVTTIPTAQYEIDQAGFLSQVLHADNDTAFPDEQLAEAETSKAEFIAKRYKAVLKLKYATAKRVIMGNALWPWLLREGTAAAKRDLEILAIRGDTSLAPTNALNRLLRTQNGFLKRMSSNIVDAEGARMNLDLLDRARKAMPDEYYDQDGLIIGMSKNAKIDYEASVAARMDAVGGEAFKRSRLADAREYRDIAVKTYKLLPKGLTYNAAGGHTTAFFSNPNEQFRVGYLEEMDVKMGEDIEAGEWIAVIRFDVAFELLQPEASVRLDNILAS
jgi:hypothetical protein